MPEARIIKRYANRKLYDTEESRYVSLDEIAGWIREAKEALTEEWVEIAKDPFATALVQAWQAYLSQVGEVGIRALFNFT